MHLFLILTIQPQLKIVSKEDLPNCSAFELLLSQQFSYYSAKIPFYWKTIPYDLAEYNREISSKFYFSLWEYKPTWLVLPHSRMGWCKNWPTWFLVWYSNQLPGTDYLDQPLFLYGWPVRSASDTHRELVEPCGSFLHLPPWNDVLQAGQQEGKKERIINISLVLLFLSIIYCNGLWEEHWDAGEEATGQATIRWEMSWPYG